MSGDGVAKNSILLRPALEDSFLSQFVKLREKEAAAALESDLEDAAFCSHRVEVTIRRTHLLRYKWIYWIAHSKIYRALFLPLTLFMMLYVAIFRWNFLQSPYLLILFLPVCFLMGLCSLTRMDKTLLKCLIQRFDWGYLSFVMINFVVWNTWAQTNEYNLWYIISYVIIVTPMSLVLLHLDSVPKYPSPVKITMLVAGITLTGTVVIGNWVQYIQTSLLANESDASDGSPLLLIPSVMETTTLILSNQAACEVLMFLLRNLYLTFLTRKKVDWKKMTTLKLPLEVDASDWEATGSFKLKVCTKLEGAASTTEKAEIEEEDAFFSDMSSIVIAGAVSPTTVANSSSSPTPVSLFSPLSSAPSTTKASAARRFSYQLQPSSNPYFLSRKDPTCALNVADPSSLLELTIPFAPLFSFGGVGEYWRESERLRTGIFATLVCLSVLHCALGGTPDWQSPVPLVLTVLIAAGWAFCEASLLEKKLTLHLLTKTFEVPMFFYQVVRVFGSQIVMNSSYPMISLGVLWVVFNAQVILLDSAITHGRKWKTSLILFCIFLSILLLVTQRIERGILGGDVSSCFLDCASSSVRFFIALVRVNIFQFKYLFRAWFYPQHFLVIFIPILYKFVE